ncbi:MAG: hypothetical protein CVV22_06090 [Ignavibacteriae bacterium HGW-Ignavibacteriae-1]|jgi:ketosteroid isomerase-like protein|nr:MAG: hypothetical protein CVV22_06090 [Ignavibacteriae bacterium HGW-Ignavibacteriae-1]
MNYQDWSDDLFKAIDGRDAKSFASFLAEDVTFTMGNFPPVEGKDNVEQAVGGFFDSIKGLQHSELSVFQDGNTVISKGKVTYTRHNDTQLTVGFCNVLGLVDDKVKDYEIFLDVSQLYA